MIFIVNTGRRGLLRTSLPMKWCGIVFKMNILEIQCDIFPSDTLYCQLLDLLYHLFPEVQFQPGGSATKGPGRQCSAVV